jgi:hypothetical protein
LWSPASQPDSQPSQPSQPLKETIGERKKLSSSAYLDSIYSVNRKGSFRIGGRPDLQEYKKMLSISHGEKQLEMRTVSCHV